MTLRFLLLAAVCVVVCRAASTEYPCTYEDYDLSGMYRSSSQDDYSYKNPTGDDTFYINVCGETNKPCDPSYHAGSCQDNGAGVWYPCGDASKGTFNDYPTGDEGVQLVYGFGMDCNGVARVTTLNIKCDPSAEGTGVIDDVDETVACRYTAAMRSKYACKKAPAPPIPPAPPAPSMPYLGSFNDTVYMSVQEGKYSGYGEIYYDATTPAFGQLLINGTDQQQGFGTLSVGYQTQVTKVPDRQCHSSRPYPRANNLTALVTEYYGVLEYQYIYFNTGKRVKVNAWGGRKYVADDDDDDRNALLLMTDVDSDAIVWANGLAFFSMLDDDDASEDAIFGHMATYEFDPSKYNRTAPSGSVFRPPDSWEC